MILKSNVFFKEKKIDFHLEETVLIKKKKLLRTSCPHLGSFWCYFFFHYVSAKFHLWPSSGDLPRPRIGMLSLVTVSPVITAFHSCLSHYVFWPSKPLAGLGRIWNRYLLTMITWNRRDSTPLSAAPRRAIKDGFFCLINPIICSPNLVFHSRVRTEFVISLIGINLRWGFLIWELIFFKSLFFLFIADFLSSFW